MKCYSCPLTNWFSILNNKKKKKQVKCDVKMHIFIWLSVLGLSHVFCIIKEQ